jgi:hypothetical protein
VGEYIVIIGLVGLGLVAAFKTFGARIFGASGAQGETVTCVALGDVTCGGATGAGGNLGPIASNGPVCTGGTCKGGSNCFVAGTAVATPTGFTPIEQIHSGDEVLTFREETGETTVGHVSATFVTPDRDLLEIHVRGDEVPLRATPGHRFFTLDRGWIRAEELAESEPLVDPLGAAVFVDYLAPISARDTVYNFEVDDTHTYFVGADRILVHNPVQKLPSSTTSDGTPGTQHIVSLNHPGNAAIIQTSPADGAGGAVSGSVSAYRTRYPGAKFLTYENLEPKNTAYVPNALSGRDDIIVIGHGYPGSIQWGSGWISGQQLAGKLQQAGYSPADPGAEAFILACNGGTSCNWLGRPSVAQSQNDAFNITSYGPGANTPTLGLLPPQLGGQGFATTTGGTISSTQSPGDGRFPVTPPGGGAPYYHNPVVENVDNGTMVQCTATP